MTLQLLQTRDVVARLALLLFVRFQLAFKHLHLAADAKKSTGDDGLTRPFRSILMLNFLLGNLRELGDGALEVNRLSNYLAVKMHRVAGDFGDHVLLREVQRLLILQINVHIRVLATVDLAILGALGCRLVADRELHFVLRSQLVASYLRLCQDLILRLRRH